jgi:hypothetical protein
MNHGGIVNNFSTTLAKRSYPQKLHKLSTELYLACVISLSDSSGQNLDQQVVILAQGLIARFQFIDL